MGILQLMLLQSMMAFIRHPPLFTFPTALSCAVSAVHAGSAVQQEVSRKVLALKREYAAKQKAKAPGVMAANKVGPSSECTSVVWCVHACALYSDMLCQAEGKGSRCHGCKQGTLKAACVVTLVCARMQHVCVAKQRARAPAGVMAARKVCVEVYLRHSCACAGELICLLHMMPPTSIHCAPGSLTPHEQP